MRRGFGYNGFGFGGKGRSVISSLDVTAGFALYLDFQNGVYRGNTGKVSSVSSVGGYSSTRAGTELRLSSGGVVTSFAANAAAIISGDGYFSQATVTNLFLRSQGLSNASWSKAGGVVVEDATTAPDGTVSADRMHAGATLAEAWQLFTLSVTPYTIGAFFKADGSGGRYPYLFLGGAANALAFFDIQNGVPATLSGSAAGKSSGMVACPNGWYFGWLTANATASSAAFGTGWSTVDGTATAASGVGGYQWQQQLVLGSNPGPLILTTTATVASAQPVLSFTVANGTYTEVTTFDDGSTQTRSVTVSGTTYTLPVYPTVLNRPLIRKVTLA